MAYFTFTGARLHKRSLLKTRESFLFKRCLILEISRNFLLKVDSLEPGVMIHDDIPVYGRLR